MRCFRTLLVCALLATWFVPTVSPLWAAAGILVLHVKDVQRRPVSGLQIGVEGDGGSARTGDDGKARIRLAAETKEKSWVSLQILTSPHNRDFVLVSPWDYRVLVPSFENESENFVEVVVVQRGGSSRIGKWHRVGCPDREDQQRNCSEGDEELSSAARSASSLGGRF